MAKGKRKRINAIYPLVAIFSSLIILIGGLLTATHNGWIYLLAVMAILIIFGMGKYLLKALPLILIMDLIYFGICYLITKSLESSLEGAYRITGVGLAVVPGLSVPYVNLIRCLNQLKCPRQISLGFLITFRFYPILLQEIRQVRQAMKTRGCGYSFKYFYRSTVLPFCLQLVNISDLLALSVETRGFALNNKKATVFKTVCFGIKDAFFLVLISSIFVVSLIFLPKVTL